MHHVLPNLRVFLVQCLVLVSVVAAAQRTQAKGSEEIPVVENPLSVIQAQIIPHEIAAGGSGEIKIDLQLVEHYKAYVDRFKLRPATEGELKIADPRLSPIVQFLDSVTKKMKDGVKDKSELRATIEVPLDTTPGEKTVELVLGYQACTTEFCLFPSTMPVKVKYRVVSGAAPSLASVQPSDSSTTPAVGAANSGKKTSELEKALNAGLLSAFIFVFLGGILTSLTPCVYPMIPITLAVIGARTKGQTRMKSFTLSVTYVLGIATTYSILGVAAASTGAMFGAALSNVYIVTAIALLFVAMGLSMYGLYEIQVPAFVRDRLGSQQTGSGYTGVYMTGLISGVVASPCVGPVLVTILAWIAQSGNRALGFGLLFTFAIGMGLLLIALGTFSHLLNKVPKGGSWMEVVKFTFGTAMVAMALYYVEPLYPTWLFHALLALALILIASVYGAFEANEGLSSMGRLRKGAMIVSFVIGLVFALSAVSEKTEIRFIAAGPLSGAGLASGSHAASSSASKLNWQPYEDSLVTAAASQGKAVLVDFYADWCAACKEFEHETFPDPRVVELSSQFILLKIDATEDTPEIQRLKKKYGVIGLPTMVFYNPSGQRLDDLTVTGFEGPEAFSARMRQALGASLAAAPAEAH